MACTYDVPDPQDHHPEQSANIEVDQHRLKRPRETVISPKNGASRVVAPSEHSSTTPTLTPKSVESRLDRLTAAVKALREQHFGQDEKVHDVNGHRMGPGLGPQEPYQTPREVDPDSMAMVAMEGIENDLPTHNSLGKMDHLSLQEGGRSQRINSSYFS